MYLTLKEDIPDIHPKYISHMHFYMVDRFNRAKVLSSLYSDQSPFQSFLLVICGHSLGAGLACLLAIMLRPIYPSLKCFAFCPPGACVDVVMAKFCERFVTCFVRQDDLSKCVNDFVSLARFLVSTYVHIDI